MVGTKKTVDCGNIRFVKKNVVKKEINHSKKSRAPKEKPTTVSHARSNRRASKDKFRILVQNNFVGGDLFVTVTYSGTDPISADKQKRDQNNFLRRLSYYYKKKGFELKYVLSMERIDSRPHNHLIINKIEEIDKDIIEKIWSHGRIDVKALPSNECFIGFSDYIIKESTNPDTVKKREFAHAWKKSKNVTFPEEKTERFKLNSISEATDFLDVTPDPGFRLISKTVTGGIIDVIDMAYAGYIEIK